MKNKKELSKCESEILINLINMFSDNFITGVNNIAETLKRLNMENVKEKLPNPFNGENLIALEVLVSLEKKSLFFNFKSSNNSKLEIVDESIGNSPFNLFNIRNDNSFKGILVFQNCILNELKVEYGFIISFAGFVERILNINEFVIDFVNSFRDYHQYKNLNERENFLEYLYLLKQEMETLLFDETIPELTIDKFFEKNPIVLKRGLHLEQFKHQVIFPNSLKKYEHDLKPDLIAYDSLNKKWVIVDYKRAKKTIIKNHNKVRTSFKSCIFDLQVQLREYIDFFDEKENREYILNEYKIEIKHPDAIGIIGNVNDSEQEEYNRLTRDLPRWYRLIPYNYLYDSFCNYIELVHKNFML